jgi:hypothetical protein
MNTNLLYGRKIKIFDYDSKDSILTISFKNGISKRYYGVPQTLYENMRRAADQNGFYRTEIDGLYRVK